MAANPSIQLGTDGNWAIKEDNLLAYKKDGDRFFNKEFDFTRGSLATFVDKDGLIKISGVTNTELVTNGNFATDSNWIPETNVTFSVSNGIANVFSTQAFRGIYQLSSITAGKIYKGTITYKSNYDIRFYIGGSSFSLLSSSSDFITETVYINATGNSSIYVLPTQINQTIEIDNVSVVEIKTDTPRIDFTDDATGHLLLEPQSTNLITYSENFSQWVYAGTTTVLSNITNPSGGLQSYLLSASSSATNALRYDVSFSASTNYSYSLFLKAGTSQEVRMQLYDGSSFFRLAVNPLSNFTVVDQSGVNSYLIEDFTNGWKRVSINITTSASASSGYLQIYPDRTGDLNNVYIFGGQLEQKSYATSYIPTYGSTATRNADVCNNSGSAQDFNSGEGVLYAEIAALANENSTTAISINDGTTSNAVQLFITNTINQIRARVSNSTAQFFEEFTLSDITNFNKIAIKYKQNDFALWVNGNEVATDTSGNTPLGLNNLSFDRGDGANDFNAKVREVQVFKRAMSDEELQQLTT